MPRVTCLEILIILCLSLDKFAQTYTAVKSTCMINGYANLWNSCFNYLYRIRLAMFVSRSRLTEMVQHCSLSPSLNS